MAVQGLKERYVPLGELHFHEVIEAELESIGLRRKALGITPDAPALTFTPDGDRAVLDIVGLALSGGGIRSAAFSLGVLQALNQSNVIRRVDYLSTVSGGGYIGSSLTATMSATGGRFVFGENSATSGAPPASDIIDTESVEHIRNYSNFLIPFGFRDVLTASAIIARGLAANVGFLLPILLLAAALTVLANPTRTSLVLPDLFGWRLPNFVPAGNFRITLVLAILGLVGFFVWALRRSFERPTKLAEFRTKWPAIGAVYLLLIAFAAFSEFQPFLLSKMFDVQDIQTVAALSGFQLAPPPSPTEAFATAVSPIVTIAASIWAAAFYVIERFGDAVGVGGGAKNLRTRLLSVVLRAALWTARTAVSLLVPLLLWAGYLQLSYWGIAYQPPLEPPKVECRSEPLSGGFSLDVSAGSRSGSFDGRLSGEPEDCPDPEVILSEVEPYQHAPGWMAGAAVWIGDHGFEVRDQATGMFWFYLITGAVLLVVGSLLRPNANSLHRLYRDRLSKAFLFNPDERAEDRGIAAGRELAPIDDFRLSQLSDAAAPYHLIGCALNLQGSDFANRRGRNADFFMFSKKYVGSFATGYVATQTMEKLVPDLDLATAFAVSGAAASSVMGGNSMGPLTPPLALLNIRLGYWLLNPLHIDPNVLRKVPRQNPFFVWREISGQLDETIPEVYLTDGGHVENLGAYELLRRKCKLIVVVDAEGDADMRFPSYVSLQRYARIDLGIRISLPTDAVAETTRAWMGAGSAANPKPEIDAAQGPHMALGQIKYGGDDFGYLVYVKASLTGDENDYIRDYARRYNAFPHESTGDQFFSEEQFEVYRALGFHAMYGFLEGRDQVVAHVDLLEELRRQPGIGMPTKSASSSGTSTSAGAPGAGAASGSAATPPPAGATPPAAKPGKAWTEAEEVKSDDPLLEPLRRMLGLKTPAKGRTSREGADAPSP